MGAAARTDLAGPEQAESLARAPYSSLRQLAVPLLATRTFHLAAFTSALTFILAFGAVKAVTNFFAGTLSDRIGRKWLIVAGMGLQAAAIGLVALATTFAGWAVAGVLLGAGTAMVYPTPVAAIGDVAHPAWRARSRRCLTPPAAMTATDVHSGDTRRTRTIRTSNSG